MIYLKEGAVIVADAHYCRYRTELKLLIEKIDSLEIKTTQLILMGDIFDLLFGSIQAFITENKIMIDKLNKLSLKIEIIYLEGNHDFNLSSVFPNIRVYSISMQPVKAIFYNKEGFFAHGDWAESFLYKLYTYIIRNKILLKSLNIINKHSSQIISNWLDKKMQKKIICTEFKGFKEHIREKLQKYRSFNGWFIEGHYHQGNKFFINNIFYQNLEAMACNKSYFIVQSNKRTVILLNYSL